MDNEIVYRLACSDDANSFKTLNDLFNGNNTNSIENIQKNLGKIDTEKVFVVDYKGDLIGFCCCQLIKSACYDSVSFELTELYIIDKFQKQGIGRGLLEFVEQYCYQNNIKKIELLTGGSNINAQKFYESLDFVCSNQIHYKKKMK